MELREGLVMALLSFAEKWDAKYPNISQSWQSDWEPFFSYAQDIRRAIYTPPIR